VSGDAANTCLWLTTRPAPGGGGRRAQCRGGGDWRGQPRLSVQTLWQSLGSRISRIRSVAFAFETIACEARENACKR